MQFLPPTWLAIARDWGSNQKNIIYAQNLDSVALVVSEKRCLDMTDRQTDGRTDMSKSIFLVALINNIYTL